MQSDEQVALAYDLMRRLEDLSLSYIRTILSKETPDPQAYLEKLDRIAVVLTMKHIDMGGSINCENRDGLTLIGLAVTMGCMPMVQLLLSKGVNVKFRGTKYPQIGPLVYAIRTGNANVAIISLLLDHGADLDETWRMESIEELIRFRIHMWNQQYLEPVLAMVQAERVRREREAFAMALHERLGANSWVQALDPGVVRLIIDSV
jgi:ankyrin repeat protein